MPNRELKPPMSFIDQLNKLRSRGMVVEDDWAALKALSSLNYYRLTGYMYQFKRNPSEDDFKAGTSFSTVLKIYEFDQQLRFMFIKAIEIIEIRVRTQLAYTFSAFCGASGHYDPSNFQSVDQHDKFLMKIHNHIDEGRDHKFIAHHIAEYGGKMPLWVLVEIMTLTDISFFYANMKPCHQPEVARRLGVFNTKDLKNHLHALATLRNRCAHYGRLYNTSIYPSVSMDEHYAKFPKFQVDTALAYARIYLTQKLLPKGEQRESFNLEAIALLDEFSGQIDLGLIGCPPNFKEVLKTFL